MLKSLLRVNHLCKYFPVDSGQFSRSKQFVHAVEDVSFSLNTSETLGIVGESGCGKTTTGRLILRLIRPTSGEIFLEDSPNLATLSDHAIRPYRRRMQMVFQDPFSSLNPRMTVGSIIREPLDIHSICPRLIAPNKSGRYSMRLGCHYRRLIVSRMNSVADSVNASGLPVPLPSTHGSSSQTSRSAHLMFRSSHKSSICYKNCKNGTG